MYDRHRLNTFKVGKTWFTRTPGTISVVLPVWLTHIKMERNVLIKGS